MVAAASVPTARLRRPSARRCPSNWTRMTVRGHWSGFLTNARIGQRWERRFGPRITLPARLWRRTDADQRSGEFRAVCVFFVAPRAWQGNRIWKAQRVGAPCAGASKASEARKRLVRSRSVHVIEPTKPNCDCPDRRGFALQLGLDRDPGQLPQVIQTARRPGACRAPRGGILPNGQLLRVHDTAHHTPSRSMFRDLRP